MSSKFNLKSFLLVIIIGFSVRVSGQSQLTSFEKLLSSFKEGRDVKAVIYYGNCDLFSEGVKQDKSPNAIGGMKLDTYEYFDSSVFKGKLPSFISASQTVLINHRKYGYVYNYVKLRILSDGSVEITARYLRPRRFSSKYKVVMDETFKTKINDTNNNGGIVFFSN
jgi:hypothetical protein